MDDDIEGRRQQPQSFVGVVYSNLGVNHQNVRGDTTKFHVFVPVLLLNILVHFFHVAMIVEYSKICQDLTQGGTNQTCMANL